MGLLISLVFEMTGTSLLSALNVSADNKCVIFECRLFVVDVTIIYLTSRHEVPGKQKRFICVTHPAASPLWLATRCNYHEYNPHKFLHATTGGLGYPSLLVSLLVNLARHQQLQSWDSSPLTSRLHGTYSTVCLYNN